MHQTKPTTTDIGSTSAKSGEWKDLMQTMKVREVAAELKDQAAALGTAVINVFKEDNVVQVLHTLTSNRITSAPVYDRQAASFIGLVDVLDLVAFFYRSVNFICSGCKEYEVVSDVVKHEKWGEAEKLLDEADEETLDRIGKTNVAELIGLSERTQWRSVTLDAPLGVLLELLADKDTHRIPMTNDDGSSLMGIVTQFDIAKWIHTKLSAGGPATEHLGNISVSDFQRKRSRKPLVTVSIKDPLLKALMSIHKNKVMGVAAIDEKGVLQANISANDLRKLPDHDLKQFLKDLFTPVSEFRDPWRLVTCTANDKICGVLEMMISHSVHRVWIVDEANKPYGVVSLCDIIGEFCARSGYCA